MARVRFGLALVLGIAGCTTANPNAILDGALDRPRDSGPAAERRHDGPLPDAAGTDARRDLRRDGPRPDARRDAKPDSARPDAKPDSRPADSVTIDVATPDAGCLAPSKVCYSGSASDLKPGAACRAGVSYCVAGVYGPCIGEVLPAPESCNGVDDDCDGVVDDGLGTVTCGIGACKKTVAACSNGKPAACLPGTPVAEICGNGVDEDCDGIADNGCSCVHVAPGGDDATGTGSASAPYRTIAFAISQAGTGGQASEVCVASSSATCGPLNPSTATYSEMIVMKNGVSVYGGYRYDANASTWIRPPMALGLQPDGRATQSGCVTVISGLSAQGVLFGASVSAPTTLDGFTVNAMTSSASSATAAITVAGSKGAIINNNVIAGAGAGPITYGINVDGGNGLAGTPLITSNSIVGGNGALAIGVRSFKSAPTIQDHCAVSNGNAYDAAGRCAVYGCGSSCNGATARRFIRGRVFPTSTCPVATATPSVATYAVRLEDSPGASVARNALCTSAVQGDAAALRLSGDAAGTVVRANQMLGEGATAGNTDAVGLWADGCAKAAPWIVDNALISGGSRTPGGRGDGVRAVGDCHLRVDSNQLIVGGLESANNDAYGVYCARAPGGLVASRCTILNNRDILGSAWGYPPVSAGIRCDDAACARIENNQRVSGRQGQRTFGIILGSSGTVVERNTIEAGCGTTIGIGLLSNNSYASVRNNVIGGGRCSTSGVAAGNSHGVLAVLSAGANELELHSNDVFALGQNGSCTAIALTLDTVPPCTQTPCPVPVPAPPPTGPRGVVRNNILHAGGGSGGCSKSYAVLEAIAAADPRIFENNDLWYGPGAVTALYRNEGTTDLATIAQVNALSDMTASGNLSQSPGFAAAFNFPVSPAPGPGNPPLINVKLGAGSPCIDKGTAAGAPGADFYGTARPQGAAFDIGAHEYP
jgi:hypothetical protein